MEDTSKNKYVHIAGKEFTNRKYENSEYESIGMKSTKALWGSLPSNNEDYYSEWDEEYEICDKIFFDGNDAYVTTFQYDKDTVILSPFELEFPTLNAFYESIKDSDKTDDEIRKLFVEVLKSKNIVPENTKHIICQIDLIEDLTILQKAFTGYDLEEENFDEVYEDFDYKMMKGITKCFSGLEVTSYALGRPPYGMDSSIYEYEQLALERDPKYMLDERSSHIGGWDVQSVSIFDMDAVNILETQKIKNPYKTK